MKLRRKWPVEQSSRPFLLSHRATLEARDDSVLTELTALAKLGHAFPTRRRLGGAHHGWSGSGGAPVFLDTQRLSQERTADPFACLTASLFPAEKESLLFYSPPPCIWKQRLWLPRDTDYQLDSYGSFYLWRRYYRLAAYICSLLH